MTGAASAGPQAFARVLTGFNYHGPDGQVVGDRDFGTISVVGRAPLVLDYEISDDAVYSDGKPITCDDMVLAWAAQSGRFPGFDAASRAGYGDVADVDCARARRRPGCRSPRTAAFVDFGQLFAATSMMPSHVIADELGARRRRRHRGAAGRRPARRSTASPQLWNTTWNLSPDLDLKRFPSSGPYKLDSVGDDGAVVLVANDKWWGAKPVTGKITVWPRGADVQERVNDGRLRRRRHRGGIVGRAEPARRLRADRQPVGGHRTTDLRAAAGRWPTRRRDARSRCARRGT